MQAKYTAPKFNLSAFHCPICNVYAKAHWGALILDINGWRDQIRFKAARCDHCKNESIWGIENEQMIFPAKLLAPVAHSDLPVDCQADYNEARVIFASSPRSAAALLRLCIQKLCVHLGGNGKHIDTDIKNLVANGLPERIQQALDVVRVVGNNAVHPGEINVGDEPQLVQSLFELVNIIIENQISQPNKVENLFTALPDRAKQAIERRDGNSDA